MVSQRFLKGYLCFDLFLSILYIFIQLQESFSRELMDLPFQWKKVMLFSHLSCSPFLLNIFLNCKTCNMAAEPEAEGTSKKGEG